MKRFVLDASVALAWFIDRPMAPYAERVRRLLLHGSHAVVPTLWQVEVANGFVIAERRGVLDPSDTADGLRNLDSLIGRGGDQRQDAVSTRVLLKMAREFGLTAYDAAYLDAALRQAIPLATLDRQLAAAASKAGVEVIR